MYLGVDEAGKGPVLGPMVSAAVFADPASLPADVDDSKRLSPERREAMAETMRGSDRVAVGVAFVEPAEIDRPDTDMNTLTVRGQARAVRAALGEIAGVTGVERPAEPVRVVADAGDTSEARFARRLGAFAEGGDDLGGNDTGGGDPEDGGRVVVDSEGDESAALPPVDVESFHGADEADPVVGAASVVAKVARDDRMAAIDDGYPGYEAVGSGYPSDPTTRSFLRAYVADNGDVPECARRTWSTCDDVLAAAEQSGLDDF
ncbi:ribonuclease HII [Halorubrum sp. Ib24]|uniref:ribonuclease HII n=1 Tax=Halorubrum sp. Ib24 TaxID=1383850 RepID=UPI000B98257F|nr:ribonuclease HII [Halorubrum sp. Ib24]OYR37952.1 ribonuclease HII [Halorubrum sp. Ib24]